MNLTGEMRATGSGLGASLTPREELFRHRVVKMLMKKGLLNAERVKHSSDDDALTNLCLPG